MPEFCLKIQAAIYQIRNFCHSNLAGMKTFLLTKEIYVIQAGVFASQRLINNFAVSMLSVYETGFAM